MALRNYTQGLSKLVLLAFGEPFHTPWTSLRTLVIPEERLAMAFRTAEAASVALALLISILFVLKRAARHMDLEVALLATVMIFIPTYSHEGYQVFLLIPLSFFLAWAWSRVEGSGMAATVLVGAYLATGSIGVPLGAIDRVLGWRPFSFRFLVRNLMLPALATLSLLAALVWIYAKSPNSARTSTGLHPPPPAAA